MITTPVALYDFFLCWRKNFNQETGLEDTSQELEKTPEYTCSWDALDHLRSPKCSMYGVFTYNLP